MTASSASIDDLLRHEDEPASPVRRRASPRWWLRVLLIAVALTAVTVFGLRMVDIGVSMAMVFASFLALLLLRRVTAGLAAPVPAWLIRRRGTQRDDGMYAVRDGLSSSVSRWEAKLAWSRGEPERFARGVLPVLGELADERLRQRHGFTRASDPERARVKLGEPLWKFLDGRTKRTPGPRDLAAIVAQLENL